RQRKDPGSQFKDTCRRSLGSLNSKILSPTAKSKPYTHVLITEEHLEKKQLMAQWREILEIVNSINGSQHSGTTSEVNGRDHGCLLRGWLVHRESTCP
ncbi:MAG TPA: pyrimidine dimer DNA glycosylase/endonuclease V, partial [Candidatus Caenarcaniphilales bacterium]